MWCQGRRADYSCSKSHWYAQTLGWSVCSHSDAHTRSRAHAQIEIKNTQPCAAKCGHAKQRWTQIKTKHTNTKVIQRMKETERKAQSHLSNKCEDASNTHTFRRIHTSAHMHTHSRHHLVWTWAISAVVLSQSVLGGLSKSCMKVCLELSECVKLYESPWETCWYTHTCTHSGTRLGRQLVLAPTNSEEFVVIATVKWDDFTVSRNVSWPPCRYGNITRRKKRWRERSICGLLQEQRRDALLS